MIIQTELSTLVSPFKPDPDLIVLGWETGGLLPACRDAGSLGSCVSLSAAQVFAVS